MENKEASGVATNMAAQCPHLVIIDDTCVLCSTFAQFIIQRDKHARFLFAALQAPITHTLLLRLAVPSISMDTLYYIRFGRVFTRSRAVFMIAYDLGGVYWLLSWLRFLPVFMTNGVYRVVAAARHKWFGTIARSCFIRPSFAKRVARLDSFTFLK